MGSMTYVIILFAVFMAIMVISKQAANRPRNNEVRTEVIPDELKMEIDVIKMASPSLIGNIISAVLAIFVAFYIFTKFDEFLTVTESYARTMSYVFMGFAALIVILTIKGLFDCVLAKKALENGNYSITVKTLNRKYISSGKNTRYYNFVFEGLNKKIKTTYDEYMRAREGDQFYIYSFGKYKKTFNTMYYKIPEMDQCKIVD